MNRNRQEKGITLIALVITIIVLLILAGVTINVILGENGLISITKNAGEEYIKARFKRRNRSRDFEYTN